MPGACLNSWQTNCEWTFGYVWRSWDYVQRGMFVALALMLAYTAFVVIRFYYRYYLIPREAQDLNQDPAKFRRSMSAFLSDMIPAVSMLRGIASAAPFLGLAGTSYGILASFGPFADSRSSIVREMTQRLAAAPMIAAFGVLVASPAVLYHNLLRARIECDIARLAARQRPDLGSFRRAQTLLLKRRPSGPPHFALLAAPFLAIATMPWMVFGPYPAPRGLFVALPSRNCDGWRHGTDVPDRIIVLRISNKGEVFLNSEAEDWQGIRQRLFDIYRLRKNRAIYLQAEDDVPFQIVANAIDIAKNSTPEGPDELEMRVFLLSPEAVAESEKCILEPTEARPFLRK